MLTNVLIGIVLFVVLIAIGSSVYCVCNLWLGLGTYLSMIIAGVSILATIWVTIDFITTFTDPKTLSL
jgi:hypothetical protein